MTTDDPAADIRFFRRFLIGHRDAGYSEDRRVAFGDALSGLDCIVLRGTSDGGDQPPSGLRGDPGANGRQEDGTRANLLQAFANMLELAGYPDDACVLRDVLLPRVSVRQEP